MFVPAGLDLDLEYDGPDFDRFPVREQLVPEHIIRGQGLDPAKTGDRLPIAGDDSPASPGRTDQLACRMRRIGGQ